MDSSRTLLMIMDNWSPFVATNFWLFSYKSNKNQDIFLKFSAFVHHKSLQIWRKNFGQNSNSLPATAHFGRKFRCLERLYLLRYLKKKKVGEVLDPFEYPHGRNFKYLQKNGVLKFFERVLRPGTSRCPWLIIFPD